MIRYLTLIETLSLYHSIISQSGGAEGIRDLGALESALAQPRMTFGSDELYKSMPEKASALAFSIIKNHPFLDGNKRIGHAVMEVFLHLNGFEIQETVDKAEQIILGLAAGEISRDEFLLWLQKAITPL